MDANIIQIDTKFAGGYTTNMNHKVFYTSNDLESKKDEEILELIKQGNQDALNHLMNRYRELVNMKVSKYFMIGAEKEDIFQEGMIGLYKAIKSYDSEKQNSFKTFANLCIERQLITAIKTSNRQKHLPLNSYLSLNNNAYDDENNISLMDVFNSKTIEDPLDTITKKEYYKLVEDKIEATLSDFEKEVLHSYAKGESYVKIAEKLNTPVKSIDNAIQRIRKKASKNILPE